MEIRHICEPVRARESQLKDSPSKKVDLSAATFEKIEMGGASSALTRPAGMPRRRRKLVGTVATIAFVVVYALVAMMLAQIRFTNGAPDVWQWLFFAVVGMGWILPLMPLIRWMERPDANEG